MAPEGESRRDRLAQLSLERMNRPPKQGLSGALARARDSWNRFITGSGWEKGFFAVAVLLIAGLAIGALFMLTSNALGGGGGKKQAVAGDTRPTATARQAPPTSTAIVIGVPTLPTALPTSRTACEDIRGTSYNSDAERAFYEQNCLATPEPPSGGGGDDGGGGNVEPTEEPPPEPTEGPPVVDAGYAVDVAAYWIEHNAPQAYTVDSTTCNPFQTGGHWVVTCSANVVGCQGSACVETVSVCVYPEPLEVRPANQC